MSDCLASSSDILLERVARGDKQGLGELFARHRDYVRKIVDARLEPQLRARVDPSDIVQDALIVASRRIDKFLARRPTSFRIWLRGETIQQLADIRRRHYAQKRDVRRESPIGSISAISIAEPLLGERASEILQKKELLAKVISAIGKLTEIDREILLLRYTEGLSNSEIAEVLKMRPSTVSIRRSRALRKLAILLRRHKS